MSLLDMQRCYARLLTDQSFCQLLLTAPPDALAEYDLTSAEQESLANLDFDRMVIASQLWQLSRLSKAMTALPLTKRVIRSDLPALAQAYSRIVRATAPRLGRSCSVLETTRAYEFLTHCWQDGTIEPNYLGELMRFEMMTFRLLSSEDAKRSAQEWQALNADRASRLTVDNSDQLVPWRGQHAVVRSFGFDPIGLAMRLGGGDVPASAERRNVWVLGILQSGGRHVVTLPVNPALAALVEYCDGRRPAALLLRMLQRNLRGRGAPAHVSLDDAVETLNALQDKGVIAYGRRSHSSSAPGSEFLAPMAERAEPRGAIDSGSVWM